MDIASAWLQATFYSSLNILSANLFRSGAGQEFNYRALTESPTSWMGNMGGWGTALFMSFCERTRTQIFRHFLAFSFGSPHSRSLQKKFVFLSMAYRFPLAPFYECRIHCKEKRRAFNLMEFIYVPLGE